MIQLATLTGFKSIASTLKSAFSNLARSDKPAPPPKPIEFPAISGNEAVIPLAPLVDFDSILPRFKSVPSYLAGADEPPPPPPTYTRKRRVIIPDDQQRRL